MLLQMFFLGAHQKGHDDFAFSIYNKEETEKTNLPTNQPEFP